MPQRQPAEVQGQIDALLRRWGASAAVAACLATLITLAENSGEFVVSAGPGAAAALQTNPLAVGVPAGGDAIVLDMATSAIAGGKIDVARARGYQLPEGSILDRDGRPTTDPND